MSVPSVRDAVLGARHAVADYLELRSTIKHHSRLGRRQAPAYTAYWRRCQAAFGANPPVTPEVRRTVEDFRANGFTAFWTADTGRLANSMLARIRDEESRGVAIWDDDSRYRAEIYTTFPEIEALFRGTLGEFLAAMYGCSFKIFYGILYKSERLLDAPTGSQLWHADGGPGTCTNVMFCLNDLEPADGAMECLPWARSLEIFKRERAALREMVARGASAATREQLRALKCDFFRREIEARYAAAVEQPTGPAGLVLPFRNNILHKGGYPEPGRTRYACVFHVYPSDRPVPWERYRRDGIAKTASYPRDPVAEF